MFALLTVLAFIFGVPLVIAGFVAVFAFLAVAIPLLGELSWMPDWVNAHNPIAWILALVALGVAVTVVSKTVTFIVSLLAAPLNLIGSYLAFFSKKKSFVGGTTIVLGQAVLVIGSLLVVAAFGTGLFMNWIVQYEDMNVFFKSGNPFAWIVTWFAFVGILFPKLESN